MNKIVKSIELTFENLDYIVIPSSFFCFLSIEDITASIGRLAVNAILRYKHADSVSFVLNKTVNESLDSLDTDISFTECNTYPLFERILSLNDITHIKTTYTDDTFEEVSVPWSSSDEYGMYNELQKSSVTEDGNLLVEITYNRDEI